jgi:predicted transcriptional regulator
MTDTTIRVNSETRQRLKMYASLFDITQDEALQKALDEAGAPKLPENSND